MANGRSVRMFAVVAVVGLAAAACSKPATRTSAGAAKGNRSTTGTLAPNGATPGTNGAGAPSGAGATGSAASGTGGVSAGGTSAGSGSSGSVAGATTGNGVAINPNLNSSYALSVGQKIYPQSTTRGPAPFYNGVTNNTIQLDFARDVTSCGINVINAVNAAGATLPSPTQFYRAAPQNQQTINAEETETIALMVRYWNDHAFDAASYLPHIRSLMGNDPANQWFGRHLTYKIIDGGSNQCPDKTKAAAVQAAEQDHAFVVFNDFGGDSDSNASAYNMAADLNTVPAARRPMHFGTLWLSDTTYNQFAPYAWTQFATGTTMVDQLASYVCSRLVGKKASNSPMSELNGGYQNTTRKFGLVHTNLAQDQLVVNDFKAALNSDCAGKGGAGIIAKEVAYDGTDFSNAQRDDTNLVVQMHTSGITSVIMLGDPVQALFQIDQASGQHYYPEWIFTSNGYEDSSTVQRLWDQTEAKGDFGITNLGVLGGFAVGAGDPFYMYHTYHQTAPDGKPCDPSSEAGMDHGQGTNGAIAQYCKAPRALQTWYYVVLPFIGGMFFAGPNLTPQNVSNGLQHYPSTRYGGGGPTPDPRPALVGAGPGKYGFIVDATEWKWRPDFTAPQPDGQKGWVQYPDCQRHYISWPSNFAPSWGPSDAAYNAWCNLATGYPRTESSDFH